MAKELRITTAVPLLMALTLLSGAHAAEIGDAFQMTGGSSDRLILTDNDKSYAERRTVSREYPDWVVQDATSHVSMNGYDPVSYFDQGFPLLGDPRYEATFHGATFRFASEAHWRMFLADPEHYAPAFGGYDAEQLREGRFVAADPLDWAIVDDQLILGVHRIDHGRSQREEATMIDIAAEKWRTVDAHYRDNFFQAHQADFRN
ncbi:MAG: YHS domain-containing (seleno)protein [Pseudomonadota bacterium]